MSSGLLEFHPLLGGESFLGTMKTLEKSANYNPLDEIRTRTPARIFTGRSGPAYRTRTQLALRSDHALARDAVQTDGDWERDLGPDFLKEWDLFEVSSQAQSKAEYLMRPDLGRRLNDHARAEIMSRCAAGADLQVVIGDGLSVAAIIRQVPHVLPLLHAGAEKRGWRFGHPFLIRYCRVGVLNDIGELLDPTVIVLLIGERPGLMTAESLSAYMAYRPRRGHTDAERNLVSNIHVHGVAIEAAADRILRLAELMRRAQLSGVAVKEELGALSQSATPTLSDASCGGG